MCKSTLSSPACLYIRSALLDEVEELKKEKRLKEKKSIGEPAIEESVTSSAPNSDESGSVEDVCGNSEETKMEEKVFFQ